MKDALRIRAAALIVSAIIVIGLIAVIVWSLT